MPFIPVASLQPISYALLVDRMAENKHSQQTDEMAKRTIGRTSRTKKNCSQPQSKDAMKLKALNSGEDWW